MSILLTNLVIIGLLLGWDRGFSSLPSSEQRMFWSCGATSVVFGFLAELSVARWRLGGLREHRWRRLLGHIVTNWLAALGVSAIALALLALPIFDSMRFLGLVVSVIVIEFVVVCSIASIIHARRQGRPRTRAAFLRSFGNYALLNIVSMVVGVVAGRLYLNLFYPGVG
jgi:hypothetical protein